MFEFLCLDQPILRPQILAQREPNLPHYKVQWHYLIYKLGQISRSFDPY